MIYDFKGTDYPSLDTISTVVRKVILDKTILQSFNSAVPYTASNTVWKGYIIGKLVFENERFAWVRISSMELFLKIFKPIPIIKLKTKKTKRPGKILLIIFRLKTSLKKGDPITMW
jgi:hypothetical protein